MDTFQNDTSSPISTEPEPETPQPLQSVPTETVQENVTSPTPPPVTVTPTKSNKNYLEIGILLVILAILAGLVTWYFVSKNQTASVPQEFGTTDQIVAEASPQPTIVEVTPTMEPRALKVMADCKMHNVNPNGEITVLYENDELCDYGNSIIVNTQEYIQVWDRQFSDSKLKLLKISDGTFLEFPEYSNFGYYHPVSKNFYTTSYGTSSWAVYKGPVTNLKAQKIFEFDMKSGGRGTMAEDDIYVVPNTSETYIIYQDTTKTDFLSETALDPSSNIGAVYGGMAVFTSNGNKLLEIGGAFRTRWINDDSFVTLVRSDDNTQLTIRKYTITTEGKYNFVDLYRIEDKESFGEIYNIDIYNEIALLNVFSKGKHLAYRVDLSGVTTTLIKYSEIPASGKIIGTDNLLGYGLIDCDPSQEPGTGSVLECPIDWVFDDYKSDIRLYNTVTKETKTLLELDEMYLL